MPVLGPGSRSQACLPVLNSIQDLDDVREGGIWVERGPSSPSTVPRHVILNLIQDPFPRLFPREDAQMGPLTALSQVNLRVTHVSLTYREQLTILSLRAQQSNLMPSGRVQPPNPQHEIAASVAGLPPRDDNVGP